MSSSIFKCCDYDGGMFKLTSRICADLYSLCPMLANNEGSKNVLKSVTP